MPSKGCAVALAGVGAYAAAQAFVAPTAPQVQEQREVRQLRQQAAASVTSTTSSAAALALGAAGVAAAGAQAGKRTQRRCQVVRQATAVAEKTFTKMPASVKPGVVTGQALVDLLNYAKENEFAIPGVNVVSSSSINACMEAAKKAGGPIMVTFSNYAKENEFAIPGVNVVSSSSINACMEAAKKAGGPIMVTFSKGGGQFIAGKAADNSDDAASIAGTVAGALHVRQVAKLYGVYETLSAVPNGKFTVAAAFGNVHGVYAPGNVSLKPVILHNTQKFIKEKLGTDDDKPDIRYAIEAGVIKMNIDTESRLYFVVC
eukprot:s8873_g2.t1